MVCCRLGSGQLQKIFNAVADALEWCVAEEGVGIIYHYLDDFAVLGPPNSEECGVNLQKLKLVCKDLGIPLAAEKQAGPSTCIEFLGIIIDTIKKELRLPRDKLDRLLITMHHWQARKSCTRRELVTHRDSAACMHSSSSWTLISPAGNYPAQSS